MALFDTVLLASTARTATVSSSSFINTTSTGLMLILDVTVIAATPSVTAGIEIWDQGQGAWVTLATFGAATAVSENVYVLARGATAVGGITEAISATLPQGEWRVTMTHADADSITYSLTAKAVDES